LIGSENGRNTASGAQHENPCGLLDISTAFCGANIMAKKFRRSMATSFARAADDIQ
jgi:hypothetical protein